MSDSIWRNVSSVLMKRTNLSFFHVHIKYVFHATNVYLDVPCVIIPSLKHVSFLKFRNAQDLDRIGQSHVEYLYCRLLPLLAIKH